MINFTCKISNWYFPKIWYIRKIGPHSPLVFQTCLWRIWEMKGQPFHLPWSEGMSSRRKLHCTINKQDQRRFNQILNKIFTWNAKCLWIWRLENGQLTLLMFPKLISYVQEPGLHLARVVRTRVRARTRSFWVFTLLDSSIFFCSSELSKFWYMFINFGSRTSSGNKHQRCTSLMESPRHQSNKTHHRHVRLLSLKIVLN